MKAQSITVVGAGIVGLWQALTLARAGHRVRLVERSSQPFADAASRLAGAMLAPYCEAEAAGPVVRDLGLSALPLWRRTVPGVVFDGTLVVAPARDRAELTRFARLTEGHRAVGQQEIAALEPDLGDRFANGLFFADEGHVVPAAAMGSLLDQARAAGVDVRLGSEDDAAGGTLRIDCRGLAARDKLPGLRGVRGERLVIRTPEVRLSRPVRLLHPRHPLYIVPWGDGRFLVGATVIESEDAGPVTVRSALDLLALAYTVHPAFGEAEIVEMAAGLRPAFADNLPRIIRRGDTLFVNGVFRHGFLIAPALAQLVAETLEGRSLPSSIVTSEATP